MEPEQFREFLKYSKGRMDSLADPDKLHLFMDWCNRKDFEELLLRLSSESRGGWGENIFLDFTTKRIIISRKKFFRKFLDLGYVAGMAPYPYLILSEKVKNSDVMKKSASIDVNSILLRPQSFYVWYDDVERIEIRKGTETIVHNMMGSMIQNNFLKITTSEKTYDFKLPTKKDGHFDRIFFWLDSLIPVSVIKS
ncbi:MAG: hypothetical protein ACRD4W_03130 [Nitrososphaeraceae archaeon]